MSEAAAAEQKSRGATRTAVRKLVRGLLFLLPALALGIAALAWRIDAYGQADRAEPADAIVILGAAVAPGGYAGNSLHERTMRAVELHRRGLAPRIICTGGVGRYPPSEASVEARVAMKAGVRREDLFLEETSKSTWGNAVNASDICRQHGWKRVIVVSDPYHLWRAKRDFERAGLSATTSPALKSTLNTEPYSRVKMTLREAFGVLLSLFPQRR